MIDQIIEADVRWNRRGELDRGLMIRLDVLAGGFRPPAFEVRLIDFRSRELRRMGRAQGRVGLEKSRHAVGQSAPAALALGGAVNDEPRPGRP